MAEILSKIDMTENYMETLRKIPAGETRIYSSSNSDAYQGFKMAKSRLKKQQNADYVIERTKGKGKDTFKITRLENKK
mgnify:CR=1 FL=1